MEDKISKIDLLQELINDILSEKQESLVPEDQDLEVNAELAPTEIIPVAKTLAYTSNESELSSVDRANELHELKKEVNQFLNEQTKKPKSLKDSLALVEKINAYYLSKYQPKKVNNRLFNNQLRTTSEQALLVHKKRRQLKLKSQKIVSSNSIKKHVSCIRNEKLINLMQLSHYFCSQNLIDFTNNFNPSIQMFGCNNAAFFM